ncbi:hypothetical protein ACVWYG_003375 [Pedobacter sp. UYEF25]
MVRFSDSILMELTEAEIKSVIAVVLSKISISKTDNLRYRHPNIQFDCLLRGYIGEYAMTEWFNSFDVILDKTNYLDDGQQIDVDFLYRGHNLELKTSLIPDVDEDLQQAIEKRDIKLLVRGNTKIEHLIGDVHLQMMFDQRRKAKDNWLKAQQINLESKDIDYLYAKIGARKYKDTIYFVAWIDKQTLVKAIQDMPESDRIWSFIQSTRNFWNCKISTAKPPAELISYLKNLQSPYA